MAFWVKKTDESGNTVHQVEKEMIVDFSQIPNEEKSV